MGSKELIFHPIIGSIQRIALYETKARFYLIGSNNTQTRFRVLKIDRTDSRELLLVDDKVEYNQQEIHQLVHMIETGNRSARAGGVKSISAFGIIGFIRFLEGYYIVLATKRRKVAVIGYHSIYKIEDSALIYIPSDLTKPKHPDEIHYVKLFQAIYLSTNFYFSYSYDLTHSLQVNLAPPRAFSVNPFPANAKEVSSFTARDEFSSKCTCKMYTDCSCGYESHDDKKPDDFFTTWQKQVNQRNVNTGKPSKMEFGIRSVPEWRFVWNLHLLSPIHSQLHPDWILYITHGFVDQSNMSVFGRSIYVTVIARRSNRYAGTRFLKRGANCEGDVANEVETEQMVHDSMVSSLNRGRFSSFVQLRGSVPGYWSQDIYKMVPKPAISIDLSDPYFRVASKHFNQLFERYGTPTVIVNLVKKREKKKHESYLSEEFSSSIKYLNQFLPPEHLIQYYHIDMARMNKLKESKVFDKLTEIAHMGIKRTGIFTSYQPQGNCPGVSGHQQGTLQTGIIRVNCVDCLDRTNTAQFAIGKCALGYQLCALGLLDSPDLEFDTDCVRLLESLYEDHGDTLALQYGGSQLVHRIKTYRKTAPWTSQGNDIMQNLSRYVSNTFTDAEKQHTINLFLGMYVPDVNIPPLWESTTDYYLHHGDAVKYNPIDNKSGPLTLWWSPEVLKHLPISYIEMRKKCFEIIGLEGLSDGTQSVEMVDSYHDYYRPYEYSVLSECYGYQLSNSIREFMPSYSFNISPFVVKGRPYGQPKGTPSSKNPGLSGRASSGSTNSSDSNSESSSDDDITSSNPSTRQVSPSPNKIKESVSPVTNEQDNWDKFPIVVRGCRIPLKIPSKADLHIYKKYVNTNRKSSKIGCKLGSVEMTVTSGFSIDSSMCVIPPTVNKVAKEIYKQYINRYSGPNQPPAKSIHNYANYVNVCL